MDRKKGVLSWKYLIFFSFQTSDHYVPCHVLTLSITSWFFGRYARIFGPKENYALIVIFWLRDPTCVLTSDWPARFLLCSDWLVWWPALIPGQVSSFHHLAPGLTRDRPPLPTSPLAGSAFQLQLWTRASGLDSWGISRKLFPMVYFRGQRWTYNWNYDYTINTPDFSLKNLWAIIEMGSSPL